MNWGIYRVSMGFLLGFPLRSIPDGLLGSNAHPINIDLPSSHNMTWLMAKKTTVALAYQQ